MKKEMPPLQTNDFNPDLLYETSEDITDVDEDLTEKFNDTPAVKPFSRGYVANIDYDNLNEDMIFPS